MDNGSKDITLVYSKINLYRDLIGVFEYIKREIDVHFQFNEFKIITSYKSSIGDFDISFFVEEKENIEKEFQELLITRDYRGDYRILNQNRKIDEDVLVKILDSIEGNINSKLDLLKKQFNLEVYTFSTKYKEDMEEICEDLNRYINEYVPSTIYYIRLKMIKLKKDSIDILMDEINSYYMFIWNGTKKLRGDLKERDKLDKECMIDKIIVKQDEILNYLDGLQEKIIRIIEDNFIDEVLNIIESTVKAKLSEKMEIYKKELNVYLAKEISEGTIKNNETIKYNAIYNKDIEKETYIIFNELFSIQHDYLRMMLKINKALFNEMTDRVKDGINTIFYNEFFKPICYIRGDEDFHGICSILEEKFNYIIYNFISTSLKRCKESYYDYIIDKLIDNLESIQYINIFKPINRVTGNIDYYNGKLLMDVRYKINPIYESYKNLKKYNIDIFNILGSSDEKVEKERRVLNEYLNLKFSDKEMFNSEYYKYHTDLSMKKNELYNNMYSIKIKVFKALEGDFITYFDHIFQCMGKNLEYVKSQEMYYNEEIKERYKSSKYF